MKWFVITIFFVSMDVWSKANSPLLVCLGSEEKKFHLLKTQGPIYELNQRLISELVQIPSVRIDTNDLKHLCDKSSKSPSVKLLSLVLSRGEKLFKIDTDIPESQKLISQSMIKDFVEISREIFLNFVSSIQSVAPTPNCLEQEIPSLKNLYKDLKYLQDEVETKKLFEGKENVIFERLQNYQKSFQRCRERTKKKLNSGSSPAPMKD
jgi:hypothetical protein